MKFFLPLFVFIASSLSALPFEESCLVGDHSVYMTKNPDDTNQWKFQLLRAANSSIEVSTGYAGGQNFEDLLQIIIYQLENNPKIKIHLVCLQIFDFISESNKKLLESLRVNFHNRFDYCITYETGLVKQEGKAYITENHTKLIIVDEKYFLLGGTNLLDQLSTADIHKVPPADSIPSQFLPRAVSDMDVVASGPIAKKLRREFFELFDLHKSGEPLEEIYGEYIPKSTAYFPIAEEDKVQIANFDNNHEIVHHAKIFGLIAGPRMKLHTIGNIYEHYINKSQISIEIGNMYFFPRPSIFQAILNAVNRNVSLSLITNGLHDDLSMANSSINLYGHINRLNYFPIMAGRQFEFWDLFSAKKTEAKNSSVYELELPGVLYHKKVMTVDHRYSIIGSYNLGMKSEDAAYEVAVIIDSPGAAKQMEAVLNNDKKNSSSVSYSQAMGWYFNPYYKIAESFEKNFLDGIILSVERQSLQDNWDEPAPFYPEEELFQ